METLDLTDPLVFDKWRRQYSEMSSAQHLEFVEKCAAVYPDQMHFSHRVYEKFFEHYPGLNILEIGGWKGELARYCLSNFDIKSWTNIEICTTAIENTVKMPNDKYSTICPTDFFWFRGVRHLKADLLISSNTIEHFNNSDFIELVEAITDIRMVLFEAPLKKNEETWQGYLGTHILEMDWPDVIFLMDRYGYKQTKLDQNAYLFIKK